MFRREDLGGGVERLSDRQREADETPLEDILKTAAHDDRHGKGEPADFREPPHGDDA